MSARTAAMAVAEATGALRAAGVPDPVRDARRLLAHAAGIEAARVSLIAPDMLSPAISRNYQTLIAARSRRVPVSHLVGYRDFYGRKFQITADVLDPRPETETLIEAALAEPFHRVLDLGVGSGCILVTLLAEQTAASGVGVDASEAACLVASANALALDVGARSEIRHGNWFEPVRGVYDLIVSNPPYIARAEMADLAPELSFEPREALTDEADGLEAYRQIVAGAAHCLTGSGRLILEVGASQARDVAALLSAAGFCNLRGLADLDGRDRVVVAQPPQS